MCLHMSIGSLIVSIVWALISRDSLIMMSISIIFFALSLFLYIWWSMLNEARLTAKQRSAWENKAKIDSKFKIRRQKQIGKMQIAGGIGGLGFLFTIIGVIIEFNETGLNSILLLFALFFLIGSVVYLIKGVKNVRKQI